MKEPIDPVKVLIRAMDLHRPRNTFSCGRRPVDQWFKNKSKICVARREFRVFTAHFEGSSNVIGYYALQVGSESMSAVENRPNDFTKNYTAFPAVHLAYLGVAEDHQRSGIGTLLLKDVFDKVYEIADRAGLYALTLQSLDDGSTAFYTKLGFTPYSLATPPKMLIAVRTICDLVELERGA